MRPFVDTNVLVHAHDEDESDRRAEALSFWDAMIVRAAVRGGCDVLFTEDLQHGQVIDGVEVRNPFS